MPRESLITGSMEVPAPKTLNGFGRILTRGIMKHLTVGVFGDKDSSLLKKLGNKGTINDIEFRNSAAGDAVLTFCTPRSEKVVSLLQTVGLTDVPVIVFDVPSPELGEAILALDARKAPCGILCVSDSFGIEKARSLVEHTSLSSYPVIPPDAAALKELLVSDEFYSGIPRPEGPVKIPIDNYFMVRSVGTVVLGTAKRGEVGVYTKLVVYPDGTEVLVKSMQSQDKDVRIGQLFQRLGLSLKGIRPDDLKRGNIIAEKDSLSISASVTVALRRNSVLKQEIREGETYFVCIGLQCPVGRVTAVGPDGGVTFLLERPVALDPGETALIAVTTPKPPRIVGGGPALPASSPL